jgi:hypothetical protein
VGKVQAGDRVLRPGTEDGRGEAQPGHAYLVAKYDGLTELLRRQPRKHIMVTFEQVASAVPGGLPPSAYRHRAWWANETNGPHVHAKAWRRAGWIVVAVDFAGRTVTFGRTEREQ